MMMGCEVVEGMVAMRYVKRYIGYGGHVTFTPPALFRPISLLGVNFLKM